MDNLPMLRPGDDRSTRQLARAIAAQRRTELSVFEYHLEARLVSECERIDAQALSDVIRTALEEEFGILDWGMQEAAGSAAKAELLARKSAMQSKINSARIARRFGG